MEKIKKLLESTNVDDIRLGLEIMKEQRSIKDIRVFLLNNDIHTPRIQEGWFFKIDGEEFVIAYSHSVWISNLSLDKGYEFVGENLGLHKELR